MSITDELRKYAWRYKNSYDAWSGIGDEIDAIADCIDAEHKRGLERMWDEAEGFDASVFESTHIELPVDADGVPIRLGDVMDGVGKYDPCAAVTGKVVTIHFNDTVDPDERVSVGLEVESSKSSYRVVFIDPLSSIYRHHCKPTVEDALKEMHAMLTEAQVPYGNEGRTCEEIIAEYAAKLRLAGEEE